VNRHIRWWKKMVFEEIRFYTYCDMEGFFEKYFERKNWTCYALDIFAAMKDRHINNTWIDIPDPLV
jgi:hypothetical protein